MGRLTEAQRNQAIGMLRFESISQVAKFFNCSKSTISRLADRFSQTGTVKDRPRPGQQKKLSVRDERRIRRQHIANPFLEASPTARQFGVTTPTIIKILRKAGLRSRRPFRGQILLPQHKRARLEWCRQAQNWRFRDWSKVLFSDECRFSLHSDSRRQRVFRRRGARFEPKNIVTFDRWGTKSLMIWGGISAFSRTRPILVRGTLNAAAYQNQIIIEEVLPFFRENPSVQAFQQDNAPCHRAESTMQFLRQNNLIVLPWPSRSPTSTL